MSALADLSPEQARLEWLRRGMAEVVPGFRPEDWWNCDDWSVDGVPVIGHWLGTPGSTERHADDRDRASYLADLAVDGPERLVVCPDHNAAGRPDLWARCRKVTVTSALLGRTCGAP